MKRLLSLALTLAMAASLFTGMTVLAGAEETETENVLISAPLDLLTSTETCPKDDFCPITMFTDTDAQAWYHNGIHYCLSNGLMSGVSDELFDPNGTATRAQILTVLWGMEGSPLVQIAEDFNDVLYDQWYYNAIRWASSNSIAGGYGDSIFGPNDPITREQMVTILWNYAKYKGCDVSIGEETNILSYSDAFDVAEYAIPAMQWACGIGMIQGSSVGEDVILNPRGNTTRAQMSAMMMRFCEEIGF